MATYKARVLASANGEKVQNVFHVQTMSGDQAGLAADIADAWRAAFVGYFHSSYQFQGVEIEDIGTDEVGAYSAGTTGPAVGNNPAPSLPTWACVSVRLTTGRRGRAGQGRMGFSPIGEDSTTTDGNRLTAGHVETWGLRVGSFISDIASSGGDTAATLAVVSYYQGKDAQGKPLKRATPLISPVLSYSVNATLGTRLSRHPNR